MKLVVKENYEEASQYCAEYIINLVKKNPKAILGLATGTSPIGTYKYMIEDHEKNGTSYKDVSTYNLDEYCGLEATHPQSYHYFMRTQLFDHLDIDLKNTHIPDGTKDPAVEGKEYTALLAKHHRNLQLLGIGSNGHIGFNEPGTSFDSHVHKVALKESTIKDNAKLFFNGDEEAVPHYALTMGIADILDSDEILLIASGKRKAKAIQALVNGPVTEDCPASVLQKLDHVTIVCDKEAASLVK
jgi:glucosamine-6-phosphate deaminase